MGDTDDLALDWILKGEGYFAGFFGDEPRFEFREFVARALLGHVESAADHADKQSEFTLKHAREMAQVIYEVGKDLREDLAAADAEDAADDAAPPGYDDEIVAIHTCHQALGGLTDEGRERALKYLAERAEDD